MMKQLNKEAESKIQSLGKIGRKVWLQGDIEKAEEIFLQCWDTIPEPKLDYDYAQILSGGMVKFFRDSRQIDKAKKWITIMRKAYGPEINLDVEFLAATVHYDANEFSKAYAIFKIQYQAYGNRPFEGEDKKYLDFTIKHTTGE